MASLFNLVKRIVPTKFKSQSKKWFTRCSVRLLEKRGVNIVTFAQRQLADKFFGVAPSDIKDILQEKKINVFDIGARGGVENELKPYLHLLNVTLAEPDPVEAASLESGGYNVVKSLIGDREGMSQFNICERGRVSSIYEPDGSFLELYTSGNMRRFNVVNRMELPMTTVAKVASDFGCQYDYMKLDTQGSELDIVKGFGDVRPIVIKTEISFVPLYSKGAVFFHLGQCLYDLGYIMFHATYAGKSSPEKYTSDDPYSETVIPTHGDAWFCPDWTRREGMEIIDGRQSQYKALMYLFGMKSIYKYACNQSDCLQADE